MTIDNYIYDLSNSNRRIELYDGVEEISVLDFKQISSAGFYNGNLSFNQKITNIVLTEEKVDIDSMQFHYVMTKAVTFILESTTVTFVKDSWVDEGIAIVYGDEWRDRIKYHHSNYFDDDKTYDCQKSVRYITL